MIKKWIQLLFTPKPKKKSSLRSLGLFEIEKKEHMKKTLVFLGAIVQIEKEQKVLENVSE